VNVAIRAATERDLPACYDAWLSTVTEHPEAAAAMGSGLVLPLHEHELRSGRLVVAVDGGEVIGFGATLTRSGVVYLADLFVRPAHQGQGVGRALLHSLFDDAPMPRFTFASSDPSARALYSTFGMEPRWTLHYVEGAPVELDADGVVARPGDFEAVVALDRELTKRDRRADLEHERDRLGFKCFVLERAGDVLGYGVVIHPQWWVPWKPNGTRVAPVIVRDPADARAAAAATMLAARELGATDVTTFVPSEHPALDMLLTNGFTATDADAFMTSNPSLLDPRRYLPPVDVP
jgi:GNAT superfamily N-acetyltransferase